MREVFGKLEAEGFTAESQAIWRQHWDFQLHKALDVQYKQGLECINKNLPEVRRWAFRSKVLLLICLCCCS
jgi:dynein heavy chain 2